MTRTHAVGPRRARRAPMGRRRAHVRCAHLLPSLCACISPLVMDYAVAECAWHGGCVQCYGSAARALARARAPRCMPASLRRTSASRAGACLYLAGQSEECCEPCTPACADCDMCCAMDDADRPMHEECCVLACRMAWSCLCYVPLAACRERREGSTPSSASAFCAGESPMHFAVIKVDLESMSMVSSNY